jgi:hypothetical protein
MAGDGNCATGGDRVVTFTDDEQNGDFQLTLKKDATALGNVARGSVTFEKATDGVEDQEPTPLISG